MKYVVVLASVVLVLTTLSCKTGTDANSGDSCGKTQVVSNHAVIHSTGDFFELQTPDASNDCEAEYAFYFRWADPSKQVIDNDMPPIDDFEHIFRPAGEFAYFPHPNPTYHAAGKVTYQGKELPGANWWTIDFSIGNRNSGYPSTNYYVGCRLNPGTASSLDSVEIACVIGYYDVKK